MQEALAANIGVSPLLRLVPGTGSRARPADISLTFRWHGDVSETSGTRRRPSASYLSNGRGVLAAGDRVGDLARQVHPARRLAQLRPVGVGDVALCPDLVGLGEPAPELCVDVGGPPQAQPVHVVVGRQVVDAGEASAL